MKYDNFLLDITAGCVRERRWGPKTERIKRDENESCGKTEAKKSFNTQER